MSPAIDLTCGGDVDNDVDGGDDDGAIDLTFGGGDVDDDDDDDDDGDVGDGVRTEYLGNEYL